MHFIRCGESSRRAISSLLNPMTHKTRQSEIISRRSLCSAVLSETSSRKERLISVDDERKSSHCSTRRPIIDRRNKETRINKKDQRRRREITSKRFAKISLANMSGALAASLRRCCLLTVQHPTHLSRTFSMQYKDTEKAAHPFDYVNQNYSKHFFLSSLSPVWSPFRLPSSSFTRWSLHLGEHSW